MGSISQPRTLSYCFKSFCASENSRTTFGVLSFSFSCGRPEESSLLIKVLLHGVLNYWGGTGGVGGRGRCEGCTSFPQYPPCAHPSAWGTPRRARSCTAARVAHARQARWVECTALDRVHGTMNKGPRDPAPVNPPLTRAAFTPY